MSEVDITQWDELAAQMRTAAEEANESIIDACDTTIEVSA